MVPSGFFTISDLDVVGRANLIAEKLTCEYFGLAHDEWRRTPYGVFTRKEVDPTLFEESAFAQVVLRKKRNTRVKNRARRESFAILLQDPNILQALLRSSQPNLWPLVLFILTHELVHIVRFRKFNVDFMACTAARDKEERLVHGITRDILGGLDNTEYVLKVYESHTRLTHRAMTHI